MHRPRHIRHVVALKLSSALLLLALITGTATVSATVWAITHHLRGWFPWCLGGLIATAVLVGFFLLQAHSARCPLCFAQPLLSRFCSRHRKARRFLGSHRLHVARDILVFNRFTCPFCGEPTKCVPRKRPESSAEEAPHRHKVSH